MSGSFREWLHLGVSAYQMVNISQELLVLLSDREFLLGKKRINRQLIRCLGEAETTIKKSIEEEDFEFPPNAFTKAGKISKGESYRDLPYFVLDFPRLFTNEHVFAYRTMIRWGYEISCTLHLAGHHKIRFEEKIKAEKIRLAKDYICVHSSPWEHHFEPSNYRLIDELSEDEYKKQFTKPFLKISQAFPLSEVNMLPKHASEVFKFYLNIMSGS